MRGLALAEQIPTGIVHINDQTVNDEANVPFGGVGASGTGPVRRRGGEHRGVHRDPLDHDARGAGDLPVLTDRPSLSTVSRLELPTSERLSFRPMTMVDLDVMAGLLGDEDVMRWERSSSKAGVALFVHAMSL